MTRTSKQRKARHGQKSPRAMSLCAIMKKERENEGNLVAVVVSILNHQSRDLVSLLRLRPTIFRASLFLIYFTVT